MKVTWYGHSCVGVSTGAHHILIDPFISGNAKAAHIDINAIPCTHLLITHGHADHVGDAVTIAKRTGAVLVSNYEVGNWFTKQGVERTVGMNVGGSAEIEGLRVKYTIAHHSSQLPDGTYGGNPGGFVVTAAEGAFHHAGDTALTLDMQLLKRHALKFACLPIGDHFTMGPADAAEAAALMGAKKVLGLHYDTFPPIAIDHAAAKRAFQEAGAELLLPAIGETITI